MLSTLLIAIRLFLVFSIVTGVIYPLLITGIAQQLFPYQANGSLERTGDIVIGSSLIAQAFTQEKYFWPRPSASSFETIPSGASNLAPTSAALTAQFYERKQRLAVGSSSSVPEELLFTSASGLDPHISKNAALFQIERIVRARNLDDVGKTKLIQLLEGVEEKRQMGVLGEPRVNVLKLNIAMDGMN